MQQSDDMLLTNLRELLPIPQNITTLQHIDTQTIFKLSILALDYLQIDTRQLLNYQNKSKRFRLMARLNQLFYQHLQTQFQLDQMMNLKIPFVRKFILVLVAKITSFEADRAKGKTIVKNGTIVTKKQKTRLKNWLNSQWVHPALLINKQKYSSVVLPLTISKNILNNKVNIVEELCNDHLRGNVPNILGAMLAKHHIRVKAFEDNQGITKKGNEQTMSIQMMVKSNQKDWQIDESKMRKIKQNIDRLQDRQRSISINSEMIEQPSVFVREIQEIVIQKRKVSHVQKPVQMTIVQEIITSQNPLQRIKKQLQSKRKMYEGQIKVLLQQLTHKKEQISKWQQQRGQYQRRILCGEQKIVQLKMAMQQLKRNVEKQQGVLNSIEGEQDIGLQVGKLEEEIKMIEKEAKQQIGQVENEIRGMEESGKQKMGVLMQVKTKLGRIDVQYEQVCEEIIEKEQMKGEIKVPKSTVSRFYYNKKITQMTKRWREADRETKKIRADLQELREKTRLSIVLNARLETEIGNLLNQDKHRNEAQNIALKGAVQRCQEVFRKTLQTVKQINNVKSETQEYMMKVHILSGKNYKASIQKINLALEDLRKEVAEVSKSQVKGK